MKYNVLENLKLKTSKGEMELHPGQVITLQDHVAIELLNTGRITPIGKVTYKIQSKILEDYLWLVATDEELQELVAEGIKEAIYTHEDINKLDGMSKDGLRKINIIKRGLPGSTVEEIRQKNKNAP